MVGNQKIRQDRIRIGRNIKEIRLKKRIGQTGLIRQLQLSNVEMTREALVEIEQGMQHIYTTQLRGIHDVLGTSYDELFKQEAHVQTRKAKDRRQRLTVFSME